VVRGAEEKVTECWCPDEAARQLLTELGWPEKAF